MKPNELSFEELLKRASLGHVFLTENETKARKELTQRLLTFAQNGGVEVLRDYESAIVDTADGDAMCERVRAALQDIDPKPL